MIQANELRIGNYVYDVGGQPSKVVRLTEEKIPLASPIPLTPEILEKAGFNLQPQRISMWQRGRVKIWMGNNAIAYLKHEDKDESYYIGECKSLHQLQNLYFALTGEELPIEL